MKKKNNKTTKFILVGSAVLFLLAFLFCCSGIRFPFLFPRSSLNSHLAADFDSSLPASAHIEEAYWVGSRDPESVFQIQMDPRDLVLFVERLKSQPRGLGFSVTSDDPVARFGPLYRVPPWWNSPPLGDPVTLEFMISKNGIADSHYRLLYSPSTGKLYLVWGAF